jgi:hypothetical protein
MSYTEPQSVLPIVAGNWWALLLRGIAAVLFGLAALFWPGLTLFVLVIFFGAFALVDGIFAIAAGIRGSGGRRWLLLAEGVLGVLAGLVVFFWPDITALVLLYVIAAWAIFTGILKVVLAISLRRGNRERVADDLEWCALGCFRGDPGGLARSRIALVGVAGWHLRGDLRRRADRLGLQSAGPSS